jgi:hypothetical protein
MNPAKALHKANPNTAYPPWSKHLKKTRLAILKEKMLKSDALWNSNLLAMKVKGGEKQFLTPKDRNLQKKLGIGKGEKVLIIAGYLGDWARAIAEFAEVTYTDQSHAIIQYAKEKEGKIKTFKRTPGELKPQRAMIYDWTFSFEPYPLFGKEAFPIILIRGMLNKKGIKIVDSMYATNPTNPFEPEMERLAELYGAKMEKKVVAIKGTRFGFINPKITTGSACTILTIHTNNEARKRAAIDLKVKREMDKATHEGREFDKHKVSKQFGITIQELEKSNQRLMQMLSGITQLISRPRW